MELVAGKLNNTFLESVVRNHLNDCSEVIAIVPYCNSTRLFELCLGAGKRVTYYGRLDESVPITSSVLKWFLRQRNPNYNCYLLRGGLHAKILWLKGEGVYIGSANLTDRGWIDNIEAGVFIREEDLASQGVEDQLTDLVDTVRQESTLLSEEIVTLVIELEERRRKLRDGENSIKSWFGKRCNLPVMSSLASVNKIKSADRKRALFLQEWNATLELLRTIAIRLREYRPSWIDEDVPDGVHVDQFLHAFYYLQVREGTRQPFDEYFERNRHDPDAALVDQMQWWSQGGYPHESESNFIHNWAPSSRKLLEHDRLMALEEQEFAKLCTQVHAIRDHAIKLKSEFIGLAAGSYPVDEKTKAFGKWLYNSISIQQKTVLQTIEYVLYGGDQAGLPDRLWTATRPDSKWRIDHLGMSSLGEIVGWALPDDFPPRNSRTSKALRALGNNVKVY